MRRAESTAVNASADAELRADAIGLLSLILWTLMLIVTLKYVVILLRADNDGEGGTLSLMALARRSIGGKSVPVFMLGVAGAAMFFGDALITPAISVLSAVEGLRTIPSLENSISQELVLVIAAVAGYIVRGYRARRTKSAADDR